jgi:hypothetical protein
VPTKTAPTIEEVQPEAPAEAEAEAEAEAGPAVDLSLLADLGIMVLDSAAPPVAETEAEKALRLRAEAAYRAAVALRDGFYPGKEGIKSLDPLVLTFKTKEDCLAFQTAILAVGVKAGRKIGTRFVDPKTQTGLKIKMRETPLPLVDPPATVSEATPDLDAVAARNGK